MSIERNLLISLLKLTQNGAVEQENVNSDARLPDSVTSVLLRKLQNENLIYLKGTLIGVDAQARLKVAVKAVSLGADVERISGFLGWQEFEALAVIALEANGYSCKKNVRFKHDGRRWEIDVVGCRKPLVVCIDCKHWHHGMHLATLAKMAQAQAERVGAFADSLPNTSIDLPCTKWDCAKFAPVIVSLVSVRAKFSDGIPVVPVLQLQDFVYQLPLQVESVRYFVRKFSHL